MVRHTTPGHSRVMLLRVARGKGGQLLGGCPPVRGPGQHRYATPPTGGLGKLGDALRPAIVNWQEGGGG